ncbi:hypothetical protein ACFQE1_06825 [Halobium palmae]|uniref:Uncharacterized protein n=1 Tax=Halobium palmae TaxID=1776492 RepID=A0ABD5RYK1_9EURY
MFGIATDGFVWILHAAVDGERPQYTHHVSLKPTLKLARRIETCSIDEARHPTLREKSMKFVSEFNREYVEQIIEESRSSNVFVLRSQARIRAGCLMIEKPLIKGLFKRIYTEILREFDPLSKRE